MNQDIKHTRELSIGNFFWIKNVDGAFVLGGFRTENFVVQNVTLLNPKEFDENKNRTHFHDGRLLQPENVLAIPLTNSVLREFGFNDEDGAMTHEYDVSYQSYPDKIILYKNKGGSNGDYLLDGYSAAPLKYFHQLQNIYFALTGEELIYKP